MSKKKDLKIKKLKLGLGISGFLNLFLVFVLAVYLMSSVMDQWIIQKSLKRFCEEQKEIFSGEEYSPAYLCTFLPISE
jgi:hypothetical protein